MIDYAVGDIVSYQPFGGGPRKGIITGKYEDVKNGHPGFDMTLPDGMTVWGYDDQIVQVH